MKIVMLTYGYLGTDARIRKSMQWLNQRNHDIVVMNHSPTYDNPTRSICNWVGCLDGVDLNYLWSHHGCYAQAAALKLARRSDGSSIYPDVVYCHELETLRLFLGQWTHAVADAIGRGATDMQAELKLLKPPGVKIIYDAHEMETTRRMVDAPPGWRENRAWLEDQCMPHVDYTLCVSKGIAEEMRKLYGVEAYTSPNSLPRVTAPLNRTLLHQSVKPDKPIVMFSGNLTPARRLPELMSAVEMVDAKLVTIGNACDAGDPIAPIVADLKMRGAILLPFQPYPYCGTPQTMLELLAGGNVGVDGTEIGIRSYELALPNKLFEYSAAGIPSVHSGHMVECAEIVREYGIGSTYDNTASGLATELQKWIDNPPAPEAFARFNEDWCYQNTCGRTLDEVMEDVRERIGFERSTKPDRRCDGGKSCRCPDGCTSGSECCSEGEQK